MLFFSSLEVSASRNGEEPGAFLINQRFSSVMVPAPLLRRALISQEITPALASFQTLNGIIRAIHVDSW